MLTNQVRNSEDGGPRSIAAFRLRTIPVLKLHSYFRSSASYRCRIALNLKGLPYEMAFVHLVKDGGQQHAPTYRALNPQALLPTLEHEGRARTQSLALLADLQEGWRQPP